MPHELKVIIYEPYKSPRSVSTNISPEDFSNVDNLVFNEDGSICNDYDVFPEDLEEDEMIGFSNNPLPKDVLKFFAELPPVPVKKQKKIERLKKIQEVKRNQKLRNKLKKLRKTRSKAVAIESGPFNDDFIAVPPSDELAVSIDQEIGTVSNVDPRNAHQPRKKGRYFKNFFNFSANPNAKNSNTNNNMITAADHVKKNTKKKKKKKKQKQSTTNFSNAGHSQNSQRNPTYRFPAFISNSWNKKNTPVQNNAPKRTTNVPMKHLDYIPIGNHFNNLPQFHNKNSVSPLINQNRYFNFNNC